ncbi:MarR family transcriptional regulator [Microbispora corallina]|uniref:MarR family transcriptional regulator n=1 Tax=Microbispora corallina TaxID=83302 RepID=A0ABQ4G1J8_9ACTN|nr:MarR family transcriptional regulator [Microbispora corallina]GIH40944.1 MarR family transcriptional regulator [Microbispora corallina]
MPETRWLDDEEQRTWRAYLKTSHLLQMALERQLQRDSGMPHAYYMILVALSESPERTMTMTQLAAFLQYSASRLSHAMARLEEKGWVRRAKRHEDRRTTVAQLTDAGFAALVEAAPGHVEEVRRILFDPLTPQQTREFHGLLDRILAGMESEGLTAEFPGT